MSLDHQRTFAEWLIKLDDQIRKNDRGILLVVDNCSGHTVNVCLTHIRLESLPPKNTSLRKPLDQGIIKCAKPESCKRFVQRFIINFFRKQPTAINVRQAMEMLTGAWWNLKAPTISTAGEKRGLSTCLCSLKTTWR
ncbi:tigger transposable element-derived protein 6-like [Dermacentor andersoni]|uniref:tigger transposable element-derived protein 6-like n=1 Tax=Dermacentor andersoni TaxID=34620 RepID=UPI0021558318|nr:tigger transposable element-derived protein 6-like [Dermacentor andersoni]